MFAKTNIYRKYSRGWEREEKKREEMEEEEKWEGARERGLRNK